MKTRETKRKHRSGGFTLLEAILALGVFALAVVGLFKALNEISLAAIESAETSHVTERMRTYLTEILRNPRLLPGETETEPDADGFVFKAVVEELPMQTESGTELQQMYAIRVQALRRVAGSGVTVVDQAETFRYAPLYRQ